MAAAENTELLDDFEKFYRRYYSDEIGTLANQYPGDKKSLCIDWRDLERYDPDLADDFRENPDQLGEYAKEALRQYDLPIDVELSQAHVRLECFPDRHTYYPGEFSPTDKSGMVIGVRGDIARVTDVYSKIVDAAFECQRCGTLTYIPQGDGDFQEPHECQGCDRQGPFQINFDQSEFIDAQKLRVKTPPEIASGAGKHIDVFVEDDLSDTVTTGDRVTVVGTVHLEQQSSGQQKTAKFEPYMDGHSVEVEETDHTEIEISDEERKEIRALANGEQGNPLEIASQSLSTKVYGYSLIKKMLVLAMVGGQKVTYPDGDHDRGEFHVLLLGDPGTGKSKLIERIEELGWRTVGVSGKGAKTAGVTAAATRDDFSETGEWTLDAGAFVEANGGVVCIDELDDMPEDVRSSMLEPMSRQSIHINKAGINTNLQTETAVVAAGNPKYGRFDPYEKIHEQFDLGSTLLSRFDLIFTVTDQPNPDEDRKISGHILDTRDAGKRNMRNEGSVKDEEDISAPVEGDILRKWIALAKQQRAPVFASSEVRDWLQDSFNDLRAMHGYDDDAPVPVTFRKLEGIIRIAEAAAKLEFSDTIEMKHAKTATRAVGQSMQDYGTNEDGELDAGVQEAGTSSSQAQRLKWLKRKIKEMDEKDYSDELHGPPVQGVVAVAEEEGHDPSTIKDDIHKLKMEKGELFSLKEGHIQVS